MKQYIYGEWIEGKLTEELLTSALVKAQQKQSQFLNIPIDAILDLLERFSLSWQVGGALYNQALEGLGGEKEIADTLALLPTILKRNFLHSRLAAELNCAPEVLDSFMPKRGFETKVRAYPLGTLLHVTANNVFLSSIDSLIMGLTTKNISLLKVGSQNSYFPHFFAAALKEFDQAQLLAPYFAVLEWKGGDAPIESILKQNCDGIILWGGEEMAKSYRSGLAQHTRLIEFGPKVSIQVITKQGFVEDIYDSIALDMSRWEQRACSNAQVLFLEQSINTSEFYQKLNVSLKRYGELNPRPILSDNEMVEQWKETYLAYLHAHEMKLNLPSLPTPDSFLIHVEPRLQMRTSPLHRTLIVQTFTNIEELKRTLFPWKYYLQTCGLLCDMTESAEIQDHLVLAGVKRFTALGKMTESLDGSPHDGVFPSNQLVKWVADERPLIGCPASTPSGFIFASGGTTGNPKFVRYAPSELDLAATMLAKGFIAQGLKAGDRVANLFMAANLWSSYEAVNRALQFIGCEILGIGGQCPIPDTLSYLKRFPVKAALGMPSQLTQLASAAKEKNLEINIPQIFYAGEMLTEGKRSYLKEIFKTKMIGSAGHASVDAGPIGYQCEHCEPNVHHVLSQYVKLTIHNEEAMVESTLRADLVGKQYPTGDRIAFINGPTCPCGDSSPRYQLLGRSDQLIMIWSTRLPMSILQRSFTELFPQILITQSQIQLKEANDHGEWNESLTWTMQTNPSLTADEIAKLKHSIYINIPDLNQTLTWNTYTAQMQINSISRDENNQLYKNPRTGKIPPLIDWRLTR